MLSPRQLLDAAKASLAVRNLGWLMLERAVRFATNLLMGFWLARYLGLADFGRLSYALVTVLMLATLSELGLEQVLRRCFLQHEEQRAAYLSAAFLLRLGAGLLCALGLGLYAWLGGLAHQERMLLFLVLPLTCQPALLTPDAWLQARLRAGDSVRVQLWVLLTGALLRAGLILVHAPVTWFAALCCVEMCMTGLGLHLRIRSWYAAEHAGLPAAAFFRELLGQCLPLLLASFATILYMRIDVMMLRTLRGVEEVGLYAAAIRFSEVWYFLPAILASSVLPHLLEAKGQAPDAYRAALQRYYDLNVLCAYALALLTSFLAPWLVPAAYGAAYAGAAPVTLLHVWTLVFVFLGVSRSQFLVNEGLVWFYVFASSGGAVLNILLNLLLIPRLGATGAAIGTLIAYAFSSWLSGWLNAATRETARMQARALGAPFRVAPLLRSLARRTVSFPK